MQWRISAGGLARKDGRLYFPTAGGLAIVNPSNLFKDEIPPQVVVERVLVDNKEVSFDKPIVVPPGKGQLEFEFTAPSFIAPDKIQFRYMLEGFDNDWTQAGTRRVAYYTNIPHGKYRFRVRAGTESGGARTARVYHSHFSLTFTRPPAFTMFIVVSGLSLFAAVYRLRVSQLKMREQKLGSYWSTNEHQRCRRARHNYAVRGMSWNFVSRNEQASSCTPIKPWKKKSACDGARKNNSSWLRKRRRRPAGLRAISSPT